MSRLTIDIPVEYHKRLKALAALCNTSIREIVLQSIKEKIFFQDSPEKESWRAMEDGGEIESFFEKLGI